MRGPIAVVVALAAAGGVVAAMLTLQSADSSGLDPAGDPAKRGPGALLGDRAEGGPLAPLRDPAGAHAPQHADQAALLKVLTEIRDELRALRTARDGGAAADATVATPPAEGSTPPAAGAPPNTTPVAPADLADVEAAIRTGEALVLGREIARCRNYMEMVRHQRRQDYEDGDGPAKADAQRAIAGFDAALQELSTVRSFRQLMAFHARWEDHPDVDVIYPKWDR